MAQSSVLMFMSAVFERNRWKYPDSAAYRTVILDAGHMCQTFCLTATWLGLAPFCTMALAESKVEKALWLGRNLRVGSLRCGRGHPAVKRLGPLAWAWHLPNED